MIGQEKQKTNKKTQKIQSGIAKHHIFPQDKWLSSITNLLSLLDGEALEVHDV